MQTFVHTAERRKAKRYRMSAPVVFHWNGPDNRRFQGDGVTRDMSIDGVFVLTATCPPPNALVRVEVIFPLADGVPKAQMTAEMAVVRVDHDIAGRNRSGFSALGEGFLISTGSERASRVLAALLKQSESDGGDARDTAGEMKAGAD